MIHSKLTSLLSFVLVAFTIHSEGPHQVAASEPSWWQTPTKDFVNFRAIAPEPEQAKRLAESRVRGAVEKEFILYFKENIARSQPDMAKEYSDERIRKLFQNLVADRMTVRISHKTETLNKSYHLIKVEKCTLLPRFKTALDQARAETQALHDYLSYALAEIFDVRDRA